jgi:outer membrane protein
VAIARLGRAPDPDRHGRDYPDITRSAGSRWARQGPVPDRGADLAYPLFQGGTVKNDIKAAKSRVEAGRATCARSKATSSPRRWRPTWT